MEWAMFRFCQIPKRNYEKHWNSETRLTKQQQHAFQLERVCKINICSHSVFSQDK
ncbi:hypothetical protein JYU34_010226 [Plutella xylostella]|uniref:Uncharacterized protein n=1 Tax=Plutella xylostella TaxID=51655 RepID=A0ABQ7QHY6_PLUXY|nr:hypothetical protein JYU34_010226 [Plutella xylostella]